MQASNGGPSTRTRPRGSMTRRRTAHTLAAFESGETRVNHVYPVLDRREPERVAPLRDAGEFARGLDSPSGRGAGNDDDARAFDRRKRRRYRMASIFADQEGHRAKRRRENPEFAPPRKKSLLVKDAVRRQEHLAMDVHDALALRLDVQVQRAVVVRPGLVLIESADDVDALPGAGIAPRRREIGREAFRRQREIVDRAFEEVPGQRRFGENDQVGRVAAKLSEGLTRRSKVRAVLSFRRLHLHDCDAQTIAGFRHRRRSSPVRPARHRGACDPTAPRILPPGRSRSRPASDGDAGCA